MGWNVKPSSGGGGSEKPPAGNHAAVLVAIIDIGSQLHEYQGKESWQRRAYFVWELVGEKQSGTKDRNHVIAIDLTVSLNEKAKLRKWIEARTGKPVSGEEYDITAELGQRCMLNVGLNKGGYPRIDGVASVPKGLPFPEPQNKPFFLSLDEIKAGKTIPDWVPYLYGEPLPEVVKRCKEFGGAGAKPGEKPVQPNPFDGSSQAASNDPIPY